MRIKKGLLRNLFILTILVVLGFFIPTQYFVIMPSRVVDLSVLVEVENADTEDRGVFYLVTITQQKANLFTAAYGYFHPYLELRAVETVLPPGMEEQEYRELLNEYMLESQHMAQVVALRRVGYQVDIISEGVEIVGFLDGAPAQGLLEEGDKIIHVDHKDVFLASEVPLLVQARLVGEEVAITVLRDNRQLELSVPTGGHPENENMPFLGIYIRTLPWKPVIPVNITMDTGNIAGPSAGLMFALEIMNQSLEEDLTAGKLIAGTGTIDLDEKVGRIGGVVQKVIAAEKAGAEYFFVPAGNYEEARRAARAIKLVPVSNLEQALDFLETLERL